MLESFSRLPQWAFFVLYAVLWVLVAWLVRTTLRRSLARIAAVRRDEVSEVLAKSLPRPAGLTVFLLGIGGGLRFFPLDGREVVLGHKLIELALAVLGVWVLVRVVNRAIDAFGRSRPELRSSAGIGKAATWVIGLAVAAVMVCDAFGVSLAPALTALGVSSLAVALALQDTLSNFFSGLYLVIDKPVRPGDFVRVDPSYDGYVESIGWRSTHLRTLANNLVIIPNATLSKAIITNFTLPTPHVASSVRVDVPFEANLDKVEDALGDEAKRALDVPGIAEAPAPSVAMAPGFIDGGVAFTVSFHVRSFGDQAAVQHALRRRIAARFKRDGIAILEARPPARTTT